MADSTTTKLLFACHEEKLAVLGYGIQHGEIVAILQNTDADVIWYANRSLLGMRSRNWEGSRRATKYALEHLPQ